MEDHAGARRVAAHFGCSAVQVAFAWLLERSPMMLPIAGTASVARLEEGLATAAIELSTDDLAALG